jgi:hypothetical protein
MTRQGLTLLFGALLLQMPAAVGAPLDKTTCEKLKGEQALLEQGGTRISIAKGPDWAKVYLPPAKLDQIRRLLEVDGQLLFRCNGRALVDLPKEVEADPAAVPAIGETPAGEAKPEAAAKAPKKAPAKKAAAAAKQEGGEASQADAPKPKPKPKAKPKANDAYQPPPTDGANPFAGQSPPATKN